MDISHIGPFGVMTVRPPKRLVHAKFGSYLSGYVTPSCFGGFGAFLCECGILVSEKSEKNR